MPITEWRGRALLKYSLPAVAVMVGVILVVSLAPNGDVSQPPWVRAASVVDARRNGIVFVRKPRAFIVTDGLGFVALSGYSTHASRKGPDVEYFCRSSGWFEDFAGSSKFDRLGEYRAGPAPRGIDRFPVRIVAGSIYFDPTQRLTGPARGIDTTHQGPSGPFCSAPGAPGGTLSPDQGFIDR